MTMSSIFVCLKQRLSVEADGGQHNFDVHARRDAERDRHFVRQGFRVLRFWNNEVDWNLEGVLTLIDDSLRTPTRPPPAQGRGRPPSPFGGGIALTWAIQPVRMIGSRY